MTRKYLSVVISVLMLLALTSITASARGAPTTTVAQTLASQVVVTTQEAPVQMATVMNIQIERFAIAGSYQVFTDTSGLSRLSTTVLKRAGNQSAYIRYILTAGMAPSPGTILLS